jgi:glycosyltransferase involved in cell wall biosynthesis
MPDGTAWPKISIVTPSFNQGQFIEETIRSVLLQGYPNLEYIIIDGGSTDDSVDIIRKYEPWLTYWVSEKDRGQSHAINKGMAIAKGDVLAYINSDDTYMEGALAKAAAALNIEAKEWCQGDGQIIDEHSQYTQTIRVRCPRNWMDWFIYDWSGFQPAAFWTRPLWSSCGPFDEDMFFAFDLALFSRFLIGRRPPIHIPVPLACFRVHASSKTSTSQDVRTREDRTIRDRCFRLVGPLQRVRGYAYLIARPTGRWKADVFRLLCSHLVWPWTVLSAYHRGLWAQDLHVLKAYAVGRLRRGSCKTDR